MTFCTCVRARTSCSEVSFSKSTLFRRSRCKAVFRSWYVLIGPPLAPDGGCGMDVVGKAIAVYPYPLLKIPNMLEGAALAASGLSFAFLVTVSARAHSWIADPKSDFWSEVIGA